MEQWAKQFALGLVACNAEDEVTTILHSNDARHKLSWKPFGGYDTNFGTINNQQQNSVAALAEKLINSVDAILIKECLRRGINPKSTNAPPTMLEAVETFFGVKHGDLSQLDGRVRRELADRIWIIAEGDKNKPTLTVADRGEGQHPSDFEKTFLSLHGKNKVDIPFVQGKYNMGGTGVLRFCGEMGYQLILSRRDPRLLEPGQDDQWGITLVRLARVEGSLYTHAWWEFCADKDGNTLTFPGE